MHDCVIVAAGASRRMGSWKPILGWGEATVVEACVAQAREAGARVLLVAGYRGGELAALFAGRAGIEVVDHPAWERGQLGSIQAGLAAARDREAVFLMNADMPSVTPASYAKLVAALRAATARMAAAGNPAAGNPAAGNPAAGGHGEAAFFASWRGERGHPVLLPAAWIPAILTLDPAGRLRDFLDTRPWLAVETGPEALADIDTPEDYERG